MSQPGDGVSYGVFLSAGPGPVMYGQGMLTVHSIRIFATVHWRRVSFWCVSITPTSTSRIPGPTKSWQTVCYRVSMWWWESFELARPTGVVLWSADPIVFPAWFSRVGGDTVVLSLSPHGWWNLHEMREFVLLFRGFLKCQDSPWSCWHCSYTEWSSVTLGHKQYKPVMPYGTARALYVQLHSEFTALGHVQWKKNEFFFGPFPSLFHPLVWHFLPEVKTIFFSFKKSKPSWKKHSEKHLAQMETNHILKSTLTGESRQEKGDSKTCLFCGFIYYFRPIRDRDHLGLGNVSKKVYDANSSQKAGANRKSGVTHREPL